MTTNRQKLSGTGGYMARVDVTIQEYNDKMMEVLDKLLPELNKDETDIDVDIHIDEWDGEFHVKIYSHSKDFVSRYVWSYTDWVWAMNQVCPGFDDRDFDKPALKPEGSPFPNRPIG